MPSASEIQALGQILGAGGGMGLMVAVFILLLRSKLYIAAPKDAEFDYLKDENKFLREQSEKAATALAESQRNLHDSIELFERLSHMPSAQRSERRQRTT